MSSSLAASASASASASVAPLLKLASNYGYPPLVSLARSSVCSLLARLQHGLLTIHDANGKVMHFGDISLIGKQDATKVFPAGTAAAAVDSSSSSPSSSSSADTSSLPELQACKGPIKAVLNVKNEAFWVRMFFGADLGFSEAFMAGEVDTPDLGDCFSIFIHNRAALSELDLGLASKVTGWVQGQLNKRYANTKGGSLKNIGAHYDISNAMYEQFLSRDMTYSCAVFPTLDADIALPIPLAAASSLSLQNQYYHGSSQRNRNTATMTTTTTTKRKEARDSGLGSPASDASASYSTGDELEDAQLTKLRLHITRCQISPGDRILEIGTGWGSLAMETCRLIPDVTIDSLTLSKEQKSLAEKRIRDAGLESQITVHLLDYRDMPLAWNGAFDRVVSIEMLEAVGIEFLTTYFSAIHRVLKPDVGTAVFQCITMPECRFDAYVKGVDFIKKYIFPGGVLPSVTSLINAMTTGSEGTMILQAVDSIGPHYARTLREWRRRFEAHFDSAPQGQTSIRQALLADHATIRNLSPEKQAEEVEVFRRKWIYYFVYCERGFEENQIGDHVLTFARVGAKQQPISFGA